MYFSFGFTRSLWFFRGLAPDNEQTRAFWRKPTLSAEKWCRPLVAENIVCRLLEKLNHTFTTQLQQRIAQNRPRDNEFTLEDITARAAKPLLCLSTTVRCGPVFAVGLVFERQSYARLHTADVRRR